MYVIYQNDELDEKNELGNEAYWILCLGGFGISIGLAVYGYKIIKAIGVKLCKITPSRGIAIELASAALIVFLEYTLPGGINSFGLYPIHSFKIF